MFNTLKNYKETTNKVVEKIGNFSFKEEFSGNSRQISSKYSMLREGVASDSSLSAEQKDYYNRKYSMMEEEDKDKASKNSIWGKTSKKMSSEFSSGLRKLFGGIELALNVFGLSYSRVMISSPFSL